MRHLAQDVIWPMTNKVVGPWSWVNNCDISAAHALCDSGLAGSSKRARQKLFYT